MSNITKLDAYFEEVDLLKQQVNKQVSYITENIQHFKCDPNVKTFLRRATYNCILYDKGDMQELYDLIHSEKLNLQNLNVGTKINLQTYLNNTECHILDDVGENEHMLLIDYATTAVPLSQLAIFYNDNHIVTHIQTKL